MRDDRTRESNYLYHTSCDYCGSSDANTHYDDGHTHCFSCGKTIMKDNGERRGERRYNMTSTLIPEGVFKNLTKRCLNEETLRKFNYTIGTNSGKTVHIAPYYDKHDNLTAQHLRYPDKEFKWTGDTKKELMLFGQQIWGNGGKMVIVTEGEIDAMSVSQAQGNRYPVVSIPNGAPGAKKAILENIDWLEKFERVIFCFDNDEPGRAAARECALVLTPSKAHITTLPLKDASEMLQGGRVKELISCIWESKVYRPDGIISGKDLLADILKKPVEGFMTPYHELNNKTKGIRKGELTLFTAGSGMGKSTLVNEIAYHFLTQHGLGVGIIALEESKKRTAERYVGMYLNKPIHIDREGVTKEELEDAFDAVLNTDKFWLYDHFGSTNIDNLLGQIKYMIVALKVDFIVLDHISIVVSGLDDTDGDERRLIDKLMTKLRSLIEETGAGVLAIVHLKRPDKGKAFTEGRQVSLSDLRGSGALEQLSDIVVAMERDQSDEENQNKALIRVIKNRPVGIVGLCDEIVYSNETGRLRVEAPFNDIREELKETLNSDVFKTTKNKEHISSIEGEEEEEDF